MIVLTSAGPFEIFIDLDYGMCLRTPSKETAQALIDGLELVAGTQYPIDPDRDSSKWYGIYNVNPVDVSAYLEQDVKNYIDYESLLDVLQDNYRAALVDIFKALNVLTDD